MEKNKPSYCELCGQLFFDNISCKMIKTCNKCGRTVCDLCSDTIDDDKAICKICSREK